jgi:simple sugar transport system permease protein
MKRAAWWLFPSLLAVGTMLVLGALIIAALGKDPFSVGGDALHATLFTAYGLSQVLFKATPLILCGLAVAIPLSAGLFNVGGEGQLAVGGLACAAVAQSLAGSPWLAFLAGLVAAVVGGGAAGAAAGALKQWRGVHEVITTIMLNFILAAFCGWMLHAGLAETGTSHTHELPADTLFTRLGSLVDMLGGSLVSTSLFLALSMALLLHGVMARTTFGFELRASGANPTAARHAGIPAPAMVVGSLALGGALAGLAGGHFVLGARRFFEEGMSGGEGFLGIAVALLARTQPLAVVPAALMFAALSQAGLSMAAQVPREMVLVLQGVVVLVLGGSAPLLSRLAARGAAHG